MENVNRLNDSFTFEEILNKTIKFANKEISAEEYEEWASNIIIKNSLSIMEKMIKLMNLVTTYNYSNASSYEMKICELYKNIFFVVYIEGYLNIPVAPEHATFENYDLLEPIFGAWIESYASRDILLFKEMLNNSIHLYFENEVIQVLNSVDNEKIEEQIKSNEKFLKEIRQNKELIHDLKDLSILNNPELNEMLDKMKNNAVIAIKEE